ncbi:putative TIR domain, P-loop containing nucleoside triphosphate hydrolase [Medicago truncatula]|uniref:Putative TIR domain, P-loop containing nucleoside triphosphate hydrolase n=1 Tax=Medicago truncatula TaxID=3880 RepID=A0A396HAH2_MEDTR|nr:putative TIR domain, P-loop containing nucleoside triphosphate hydrolase [Medicago truncatula]
MSEQSIKRTKSMPEISLVDNLIRSDRYNNEVFLSFRGEDTRSSFISHLYTSLRNTGITVFMDEDSLQRGDHISTLTIAQIVLPVFYDVDPLEVRHQTGEFGQAFESLLSKLSKKKKDKTLKWREALHGAAAFAGFVVLNSRDLGYGGIGKTTIAKAVYNKICRNFRGRTFLANIRETWEHTDGKVSLQEQLLFDVFKKTTTKIPNIESGKNTLKDMLRDKRVLLVLDHACG